MIVVAEARGGINPAVPPACPPLGWHITGLSPWDQPMPTNSKLKSGQLSSGLLRNCSAVTKISFSYTDGREYHIRRPPYRSLTAVRVVRPDPSGPGGHAGARGKPHHLRRFATSPKIPTIQDTNYYLLLQRHNINVLYYMLYCIHGYELCHIIITIIIIIIIIINIIIIYNTISCTYCYRIQL